jgi:competence ComEA-like helix-hairpin-helix protein
MERMMRWVLLVFLTALLVIAAQDDGLPEAAGKDVVRRMCVNCHGPEPITTAKYSKKRWREVVDNMVGRGAEGSDEDVAAVIGYLTRNFGNPVNVNTSAAKDIENGLSFSAAQSEALVRYRADNGPFKTFDELLKVPGIDTKLLDEQRKNILF